MDLFGHQWGSALKRRACVLVAVTLLYHGRLVTGLSMSVSSTCRLCSQCASPCERAKDEVLYKVDGDMGLAD